jgi:hypothetical protein
MFLRLNQDAKSGQIVAIIAYIIILYHKGFKVNSKFVRGIESMNSEGRSEQPD